MNARIACPGLESRIMTAECAAQLVRDGMVVGASGFGICGYPKRVPTAIAQRAERGEHLEISLITGASVGDELDGVLARANVIRRRYPFQSCDCLRTAVNENRVSYADLHLSQVAGWIERHVLGDMDLGIIEALGISEDGNIYPTLSVGCTDTIVKCAKQLIIEINLAIPSTLIGFHDIYTSELPPHAQPIPLTEVSQRIGRPYIPCDPSKIAAIVYTNTPDSGSARTADQPVHQQMADHFSAFLAAQQQCGQLGKTLPPLQSGVGNLANSVINGLAGSGFHHLVFYSELIQDGMLKLLDDGIADFASATALALTPNGTTHFFQNIAQYADKIILRPAAISNSPEVIGRLGLIAMNTAVEVDLYGNVNSSHINGSQIIGGIGGSGDFARNAGLTVFFTESTAKNGSISCIVPFCTHIDHTEHDVHLVVTEFGYADLRGLSPLERAHSLISHCAHPKFRKSLERYLDDSLSQGGTQHIPHLLSRAFTPLIAENTINERR